MLALLVLLCGSAGARTLAPLEAVPRDAVPATPDAMLDLADEAQALADEFNLTPAQRALIGLLVSAAVTDALEIAADLVDGRRAMNDQLWAEAVDVEAVEALAATQGRRLADLTALAVDTLIAIRRALREDQRLLLVELGARFEARLGELADAPGSSSARRAIDRAELRRSRVAGLLDLSASQRAAIRQIVEGASPEVLAIASEIATNRNALMERVRNAPEDRATIDALIDAQAGLFESLVLVRVDVVLQIRDLLTAGQLERIARLRQVVGDWFDRRIADMGGRFGGP